MKCKKTHRVKTQDTPFGSSCVENTKTHHKWAPLIMKVGNPTMSDQRKEIVKVLRVITLKSCQKGVDTSKAKESDMPF